jgi:hypothetical protein
MQVFKNTIARIISVTFFLVLNSAVIAQKKFVPDEKYRRHAARAFGYYQEKKFLQSGLSYDSLFNRNKGEGLKSDKYNAACSWALAGNADKAFFYLESAAKKDKWSNLSHLLVDADLNSLHEDKRWSTLTGIVKANKEKEEEKLNKPLVAQLDTIYREDQGDRMKMEEIQKQYGWKSKEMDSLLTKMSRQDSMNLVKVKTIIDKYGWLGPDQIGEQGATTLFLVIQHADSLTQVSYAPLLRQAVKSGKAKPQDLALLEDRILVRQGKKQIYGSQVRTNTETGKNEFFPIEDEPNVNKRRNSVGLQPLEDYAKFFGIEYTLPKAKKK